MDTSRSEIDKATSDEIISIVVGRYKKSIIDAQEKASAVTKKHWMDNAEALKKYFGCYYYRFRCIIIKTKRRAIRNYYQSSGLGC